VNSACERARSSAMLEKSDGGLSDADCAAALADVAASAIAMHQFVIWSSGKFVTEHRETTNGFCLDRLVLKNVPVLGELAVFEAHDIGGDP
jgi:hypothetical protein